MKKTLSIICILICVIVNAQKTYNTNIDSAGTVNIYGNGKTIIGKIIINQSIKSKILLAEQSQNKDTSGTYITVFKFVNSDNQGVPFFAVNISLEFDLPVVSVSPDLIGETTSAFSINFDLTNANKGFYFKASQINAQGFQFKILSKNKIMTKILGIDGKTN